MIREDYLKLMGEALGTEYGIALRIGDPHKAVQARRKFYRLRERLRADGDQPFDGLSLLVVPNGDLHILKRNALPRHKNNDGLRAHARPLGASELPKCIGVRGPGTPPPAFLDILKHFSFDRDPGGRKE